MTSDIDIILEKFTGSQRDNLIPILENIQEEQGYISEEAIIKVGQFLKLPASKIFGVATFYDYFHFEPKPKFQIKICNGTACHVLGAGTFLQEVENELKITAGQVTRDGAFGLEVVSCIGSCGSAPVLMVNDEYHARLSITGLKKIIGECKKKIKET
jgi:NADH:ubiquinone oxidoreductase subunit E